MAMQGGAATLSPAIEPEGAADMRLSPFAEISAQALGRDLSELPVRNAAASLGALYSESLPRGHRAENGVFYTPALLADRLLDQAELAGHDWSTGSVIDPSCGAGAFLITAAQRMLDHLADADPAIAIAALSARLRGWEVDPFAAWLANLSIEAAALEQVIASGKRLDPVAQHRDALAGNVDALDRYRLVVGNPPFGKVKDSPSIRRDFRRSLHGHPNLYGLFIDLAIRMAAPDGGLVAYVTPTSFLAGEYFKALRRLLHQQAPPTSIDLVESRRGVFTDVLQEVALSVFKRGQGNLQSRCYLVAARDHDIAVQFETAFTLPSAPEAPWKLPRHADDATLVEQFDRMPARLADWGYRVSTGPLVWNRHKDRLHADPGPGRVPIIWAESVTAGNTFSLQARRRARACWYQPRAGGSDSNLVRQACLLVQRTTAKEQRRRLVSALLPASLFAKHGTVAVENHLNMIVPIVARPSVPLPLVAAFFASHCADRVFRCISASVAVSASELSAMPLPSACDAIAAIGGGDSALMRLYERGDASV